LERQPTRWKPIVAAALITGIFTFGAGVAVAWIQPTVADYLRSQQLQLNYSVDVAASHQMSTGTVAIYRIVIQNNGKQSVSNVDLSVDVSPAIIDQTRIIPEPSTYSTKIEQTYIYKAHLTDLNPNEAYSVSILASSSDGVPASPKVVLRGQGVMGVEKTAAPTSYVDYLFVLGGAAIVGSLLTSRITFGKHGDAPKHSDKQGWILAFLCSAHGLAKEAQYYHSTTQQLSYWSESDRFATMATKAKSTELQKLKAVLSNLLSYAKLATLSEAIVHYNIARIAKVQGNEKEVQEHLEKAKKLAPKLIETRIRIYPTWKKTSLLD